MNQYLKETLRKKFVKNKYASRFKLRKLTFEFFEVI